MMSRNPKIHPPLGVSFAEAITAIADQNKPERSLQARPFLKWVGGKRSILPDLLERMPDFYSEYYEPFMGGGALFFAVQPEEAHLSDVNFHLVLTFKAVRDDVDGVIRNLKGHFSRHTPEYFENARIRMNKEKDPTKVAALFIYLNKTCFNGLYRVNRAGMFNVPIGDYKNAPVADVENLRACSEALRDVDIQQQPFSQVKIKKDAFYYLDPPYHNTYDGYNGSGFGDDEHVALAQFCKKIADKGGKFMLSNSDTPFVQNLYKGYNIEHVRASRSVSCKSHQRGKETELIIRNYR